MRAGSAGSGVSAVNHWSRLLGVSLRPWSGHAPWSLVLRGLIQAGICVFFLVMLPRVAASEELAGTGAEIGLLRQWLVLATVAIVAITAIGATKVVVGVLDLGPRRTVTGAVLSLRDRHLGDFLPHFAQRILHERVFGNRNGAFDRKKVRTELVLQTADGVKQWTIRDARQRHDVRVGSHVRLSVTRLVGHVAKVEPLGR